MAEREATATPAKEGDPRMRTCRQRVNLSPGGRCLAAWRGESSGDGIAVRREFGRLEPVRPSRCHSYQAEPADPDRRMRSERWPLLIAPGVTSGRISAVVKGCTMPALIRRCAGPCCCHAGRRRTTLNGSRRPACSKAAVLGVVDFRPHELQGAGVHTWQGVSYRLRAATPGDAPALRQLIARSIHALGADDYTPEQIDAALTGAFGIDTSLIRDGTYFVVVTERDEIVGCGGWSRRRTLFGGDARAGRDEGWLDPQSERARVRAFFIDPNHARRGLGRLILQHSEAEARRAGFTGFELMATLPGKRLYERSGYVPGTPVEHPLPGGMLITFVPMTKQVA